MDWLRDVRITLRQLRSNPGYTTAAVLTLGVAIAANSAVFSAAYAVLLSPFGVTAPRDLVVSWEADPARNIGVLELSYTEFHDWSVSARSFSDVAAMGSSNWTKVLEGNGDPDRLPFAAVTASFFDTLGARPVLGRGFRPEDDTRGAAGVVVLSHGLWARRFGARPDVVGTPITLDGRPYTVIGVMPEEFAFPRGAEFWMPVVPELAAASALWNVDALDDVNVLFAVGRLRQSSNRFSASDELSALVSRSQPGAGAPTSTPTVVVEPFLEYVLGSVRPVVWLLVAAVGIMLMIACANVAGLMLTRSCLRSREHAIRLALGATHARLASLWIIEALLLSAAGGTLGLLASWWIVRVITRLGLDDVPRLAQAAITAPVIGFTVLTVLLTALLCGLGPARGARSISLVNSIDSSIRSTAERSSRRRRSAIVMFQLALAVVLLVAAGLVVRSFSNLRTLDLGFMPADVLTMDVTQQSGESTNEWLNALLDRVARVKGVDGLGAVSLPPLALGAIGDDTRVVLENQPENLATSSRHVMLNHLVATPGYFEAMRIGLERGRLFDSHDDSQAPRVVLLGESAARTLWPGQDPIGKRLAMSTLVPGQPANAWRTVVGIVSDVRYRGLNDVRLDLYEPALQADSTPATIVVRTRGDPTVVVPAIRSTIHDFSPRAIIDRVETMEAVVARVEAPWRLLSWMLAMFAGVAAALASLGLFSVVGLELASRRREFAIRLAVGAEPREILRIAMTTAFRWAGVGVAAGLALAVAGTHALSALLFGVHVLDPVSYLASVGLVILAVALAAYLPARQAAAIEPMSLLRRD